MKRVSYLTNFAVNYSGLLRGVRWFETGVSGIPIGSVCKEKAVQEQEASRHFRNKKREYLKAKINEVEINILPSRLTRYAEEITGDHQCGFRRNRSTTDHIFCIRQILEKKWEYNGAVHQLLDFKKAYDSVRREVLYNFLIEFGIPLKLVRLIIMCLNETYTRVRVGKHLSDRFPIKNGLKQGDALSPLLFNFALEYVVNILGGSIHTITKKNRSFINR
jgi:hypothetical protein